MTAAITMSPDDFIGAWQRLNGGDHVSHGQDGTRRMGDRLNAHFLPKTRAVTRVRCQCGETLSISDLAFEELRREP